MYSNKRRECELKGRPFVFETEDDRYYFNTIGYLTMKKNLKDNENEKVSIKAGLQEAERDMNSESFSAKWPEELNEFLEDKIGDLFYVESPPIEIIGGIDFVLDMYMPQRITTAMCATSHLLLALTYYIKNNLGPIPENWVQRDSKFLVPTPDIIRFRMKTFNPFADPTKEQRALWSPGKGKAPAMKDGDVTSLSSAPPMFEDPGICYFLYGGISDPNLTDLGTSLSYLKRVLGGARTEGKDESPERFFKSLRRRFPNYTGVLLEMGWMPSQVPMSPDDLPEKMMLMYRRAELLEHNDIKERIYKISKISGNVPQMAAILKSLDEDTILKKDNAKSRKASKGLGLDGAQKRPWVD